MSQTELTTSPVTVSGGSRQYDVAVVGAGLGGLAACIFLKQANPQWRVVCIEPESFPHAHVGESLDWSSPGLLKALGFSRDKIIADGQGTYKCNIRIISRARRDFFGKPRAWFRYKPMEFELITLHVDREQLDTIILERAQALGVEFVWERVSTVQTAAGRVTGLQTATNGAITARWFIDASGQAQVFAKALGIGKDEYGPRKVCAWTYFSSPPANDGTTFYGDNADQYLHWIWESPINPTTLSVGCVMPADRFQEQRRSGKSVQEIMREELAGHRRFAPLLAEQPDFQVRTTSFRNYVARQVCGDNWFLVGEAGALADPLTANGVTAAFRHAQDATDFIKASFTRGSLTSRQRYVYDRHTRHIAHAFNHSIEKSAYSWDLRWGISEKGAEQIYTIFSYSINAFYSKWRPQSLVGLAAWEALLSLVDFWIDSWALIGRLNYRRRLYRQRPLPIESQVGEQTV